jgi:hypothetical protein
MFAFLVAAGCGRRNYDNGEDAAPVDAPAADAPIPSPDANDLLRCGANGPDPIDLVAYYPFDGDPLLGSPDLMSGLDGACDDTPSCPTSVPGVIGNAYEFDKAARQRVRVAPAVADDAKLMLGDGFTVAFWVAAYNPNDFAIHNCVAKPLGIAGANSIQIGVTGGNLTFNADADDVARETAQTNIRGNPGDWGHVAFSWDAAGDGRLRIFADGSLASTSDNPVVVAWDTSDLLFGADLDNGLAAFTLAGKLDDMRIYNRALTEPEVEALANCATN